MQSPVGVGPPSAQADGQPQQWVMMQQSGMQPQHHEEVKTLWVVDLQYWMDENYLHTSFVHTGEVLVRTFGSVSGHDRGADRLKSMCGLWVCVGDFRLGGKSA
jgi:hypothetical protein